MLSSNQIELLASLAGAQEPVSVADIADWRIGREPFGENAARNAMKRLEDRGLVAGSGAGRAKTYVITALGRQELSAAGASPGPVGQDSTPGTATRNYIVLEQIALEDLDSWLQVQAERDSLEPEEVYVMLAKVDARNTEHALRQAANIAYPSDDAEPLMIPVAERMWQPERVEIRKRRAISIG